ncbi:MAG: ATP-binding protein [Bacteroidota bacterium]
MRISVIIFVGFSIILVLFSITTYVNFRQSRIVNEDTEWLSNSQLIIRYTSRYQRNISEMKGDLRGYLLTGDALFLDSYNEATKENAMLAKDLSTLIPDISFRERNLGAIQQVYLRWQNEFANPLIEAKKKSLFSTQARLAYDQLYNSQLKSHTEKNISTQIRDRFREFNNYEYDLRAERKGTLNASIANNRFISIALTTASILIGLVIAIYITVIISKRIRYMVNLADQLAKGNFSTQIEDKARDELSQLSHSLNSMARILNENISALERKNQELDRFAYIVSHDLKAPLRGIENTSEWIEEDFGAKLPAKVNEYLSLIKGRVRRMEGLIDGILELSRVGKEKNKVEKINVQRLVEEMVEMLSPHPDMHIHIQPDLPTILTERISLQQVFTNLISNAIKYHDRPNGNISISYQETSTHYSFSVVDDGPGIEPRYHEKIFIIFQTLQARDTFESTGVGLAIVKKILDDKKCSIRVVSDVGQGSSFTFTWPIIEERADHPPCQEYSALQLKHSSSIVYE